MSQLTVPAISRRQFLIGASAVAATPVILGIATGAFERPRTIDLDALGLPPLSLGYIEGSAGIAAPGRHDWRSGSLLAGGSVVPASSARHGDGSLAGRLVKVTVHGLLPAASSLPSGTRSVSVDALFASDRPEAPWPFYAWTTRTGQPDGMGHRGAFQVELDRHPRFGVALTVGTGSGIDRAATVFGTGSGAGLAKLRPGAYLVAVGHDAWDRPRSLPGPDDGAWESLPSVVITIEPAAA